MGLGGNSTKSLVESRHKNTLLSHLIDTRDFMRNLWSNDHRICVVRTVRAALNRRHCDQSRMDGQQLEESRRSGNKVNN